MLTHRRWPPAGSGKTTVLNHILRSVPEGLRVGVLVNEFGSIDIDSTLVESKNEIDSGTVELSNGCVCCTINESLLQSLTQLCERRARLDCLILETSGVADPRPIIDTIRMSTLIKHIRLDAVVTVVDAWCLKEHVLMCASDASAHSHLNLEDSAWGRSGISDDRDDPKVDTRHKIKADAIAAAVTPLPSTIREQLEFADVVVLNKADLVNHTDLTAAEAALERLISVSSVQIIRCREGKVPPQLLLGHLPQLHAFSNTGGSNSMSLPPRVQVEATGERPIKGPFGSPNSTHLEQDSFRSVSFDGEHPLSLERFEALRGDAAWKHVVRAKGFVRFAECEGYWFTIQICGARIEVRAAPQRPSPRRAMLANASIDIARGGGVARRNSFVVIGVRGMQPARVMDLLRAAETKERAIAEHNDTSKCATCDDPLLREAAAIASEALANYIRQDPRFQVLWVRGGLVAFRMLGWFDTSSETLTSELLDEVNATTTGSGRTWIVPTRSEIVGNEPQAQLTLLHVSGPRTKASLCWADMQCAAERVMTRHLGGFVCGSCDCIEVLAGQVLV